MLPFGIQSMSSLPWLSEKRELPLEVSAGLVPGRLFAAVHASRKVLALNSMSAPLRCVPARTGKLS